jgi:16S rRNA (guanine(527)-N(7))-methyltransferase RsmG
MERDRITALLEPFLENPLSPTQLNQISTYIDLLLRWNARINLTAIRDPEQIVPRHFGESLFMARHLFPDRSADGEDVPIEGAPLIAPLAKSGDFIAAEDSSELEVRGSKLIHVVDLGSGAGFPALPIKIWAPRIHLTMIESNQKKAAFLREAIRALKLTNVDVIPERAESVATRLPKAMEVGKAASKNIFQPAEVVTFRAVEKFNRILPLAAKFLAPNARLAVLVTTTQLQELQVLHKAWTSIHVPQSYARLLAIGT